MSTDCSTNGFLDTDHRIYLQTRSKLTTLNGTITDYDEDRLRQLIHIDRHPNGGASMVHMYQEEINRLPKEQVEELARMYFKEVFVEDNGCARHVMGIVHGAAEGIPEVVSYLALYHPELVVKVGHLRKSEIETVKMEEYAARVKANYSMGTFRCGPMMHLSLVGQVSEESGGYFPEFLGEMGSCCTAWKQPSRVLVIGILGRFSLKRGAIPC